MSSQRHRESLQARVLVVDDQEEIRSFLDHSLERERFAVETVADGEAAVDRVRTGGPDAVVLDLEMPVMDGFETLRRLRALEEDVLIVVLSGYTGEEEKLRAFELGADDFVTKPFSARVLAERIRRLVERTGSEGEGWPGEWRPAVTGDPTSDP